jgi:hypothetical protein
MVYHDPACPVVFLEQLAASDTPLPASLLPQALPVSTTRGSDGSPVDHRRTP